MVPLMTVNATANETLNEKTDIFMLLPLMPLIGSESLQTQTKRFFLKFRCSVQ